MTKNVAIEAWEVCKVFYDENGFIIKIEVKKTHPLEDDIPLNIDEDYEHHLWERLRELRIDEDFQRYDAFLEYLIQRYIHLRWEVK